MNLKLTYASYAKIIRSDASTGRNEKKIWEKNIYLPILFSHHFCFAIVSCRSPEIIGACMIAAGHGYILTPWQRFSAARRPGGIGPAQGWLIRAAKE